MSNVQLIDFHAHVLPGMDHGCKNITECKKQLSLAMSAGVSTVVATPHFYPHQHNVASFISRRTEALDQISRLSQRPNIIPAAEVLYCKGLSDMPMLDSLTIGNTDCILLEMPFSRWKEEYFEEINRLINLRGYKVILAHVDRYSSPDIETALNMGCLGQLNASAIKPIFNKIAYLHWIDRGKIVGLGSDIHGTYYGYKEYSRAVKALKSRTHGIMLNSRNVLL